MRHGSPTLNVAAAAFDCASRQTTSTVIVTVTTTSRAGCDAIVLNCYLPSPLLLPNGCAKVVLLARHRSHLSRSGGKRWVAFFTAPDCLTRVCHMTIANRRAINRPKPCGISSCYPSIISVTVKFSRRSFRSSFNKTRTSTSYLTGLISLRGEGKRASESSS